MLAVVGHPSLDALTEAAVPAAIAWTAAWTSPTALTEAEATAELRELAGRNTVLVSMIGLGYHDTITPAVIRRNVLEDPGWYTAYTPYQPEISQGRLEALLNFQTMVADLTGLPLANASLLDEATAAAEAMTLLHRVGPRPGSTGSSSTPTRMPQTMAVLATRAEPLGIELRACDVTRCGRCPTRLLRRAGQYPELDRPGRDPDRCARWPTRLTRAGAGVVAAADLLGLCLLVPPGRVGRRRRGRLQRSGSACRWASAGRTPASWRCAPAWSASCPGAWSASRSTRPAGRPTGWRCRPASSTSAGRRRPATSAPRRCCWR